MSLSSFYRAIVFCAFLATGLLNAQHLTISTSGDNGPTSGTNWSINTFNNELTVTGTGTTAHIHPDVITNHLGNAGQLFIILPWQGGTERNININSSISYGGSRTATLVFYSANHINIASGISIGSTNFPLHLALNTRYNVNYSVNSGMPDYGKTAFTNNTITTKGGHFWVGGGGTSSTLKQFSSTFWIGDDAAVTWVHGETGLQVSGTTITTDGGNVSMSGWGYPSSTGGNTSYGLTMSNSTINSGAGNITLTGQINGTYTNGIGLALWPDASGAVSLTTTSGNISLTGKGYDIGTVTAGGGWRNGLILEGGANSVTLSTQSGNITLDGQASFNYQVNDKEGLHIYSPTTDRIKIISRTGNITLKGSNTREGDGQYCNGIIFRASDVSNAIRIGHDGTNAYSGNILIQSNSILQNTNNAGSGSISVKSTGTLTVEPKDNAFTYLRSGASGSLTFDNDWDFGTTLSGFTFGKNHSTALDLSYTNTLTVAGPITFHTGNFTINNNMTSSTASDITINANANFNTSGTRQTITSTGGNIIIHADKDANGTGVLDLDYLTLNPGSGNIIIRGSTFLWTTTNTTDKPYLNGTGSITIEPSSASFGQEPYTTWFAFDQDGNGMSGLTIGKSGNTTNITYNGTALTVAGPVTLYGGTLTLSSDLTCTASGDVSLYTDAALSISGARTITTTGAFKYISQSASFAASVSFPITNLTLTNVTGVQIGKSGNTAGVTIGTSTSINGYFTAYGGAIALNANITTTNTGTGDITLSGATLSGSGNLAVAGGRTASITVTSASTYDGIISGTGSGMTKLGAGTLTLTKDHTYTGSTTISAGDLQVGTGGSVSQASSGSLASTSAVSVASGSKIILSPNDNMNFANSVSGAGGLEIKGMSGLYYSTTWIDGTASTFISNSTVLEVLTRVTGGKMGGTAVAGVVTCAAYQKAYDAATNTGTFQMQVYNDVYTKCVFIKLTQSGTSVMVQANTSVLTTGAGYKNGNVLGTDISSGGTSMTLATTSSGGSGYGIMEIYLSGKVNFTGSLTYTGATTLSNTVSSVSGANAYSYTSRGTQEITDASTAFPNGSAVVNNGLIIFNRSTALTISNSMSGTEEVLQVGAAITLTGTNTHSGNTTIDLGKTLNIGAGGTSGSITGNIINYGTLTFNRSDSSSYTGVISGTGAVTKNGNSATTLTGLNTYTGATTINAGRLILQRDVPATSSSGYSGAGTLVIQPNSTTFSSTVTYPIAGFTVSSSIGGLTIGKPTNTANITVSSATTAAGPITLYGGDIAINQNLTSTASGTDILIRASVDIVLNTVKTITTNAGDVILWANSDGGTSNGGVFLDAASNITTSGGHVWIGGSSTSGGSTTWNGLTVGNGYAVSGRDLTPFQNEGTAIDWDAGVLLDETNINSGGGNIYIAGKRSVSPNNRGGAGIINYSGTSGTLINSGTGTITMLGETSVDVAGSDLGIMTGLHPTNYTGKLTIQSANTSNATAISITASTVTADAGLLVEDHTRILSTATSGGGGISMSLSSGTGSALQVGIGGNSGTLDLLSASGAIAVDGGSDAITVPVTVGTFKIGSISGDANVPSSTANVTLTSNTISLAGSVPIVTTGTLTVKPTTGSSFTSTFSTSVLNYTGITGLTIGHTTNTATVLVASTTNIAGPITIYGGSITVSSALTAAGNILLDADAGSFLTQNTKGITINAAVTTTNNGNITLLARGGSGSGYSETHGVQCTQTVEAGGTGTISITAYGGLSSNGVASSCHGINLDGSSAWIKSNGGNVTLSGYGGGAGTGSYSQGVAMANSAKVSAAGSGTINITGTGGVNTVIGLRGIVLVSSSSIYTAGGTITLTGNNGTNGSDNSDGITIDNATVGSNSSGAITLTGYAGGGTGSEAISLSSSSTIGGTTHAGNILMQGNAFSIASAASILTTGQLTIEPTSGSFSAALTYPISNLTVASTITGLTLGKSGNTANITLSAAQSVAGPIAVYGGTLTFNDNVSSTTGGNINLYGNTLSFTSGKTVSSTGQLLVAPTAVSTTVGMAGATGTLQVTSTHFSTNFANGFSNITIGSDAQTGNIASNAFTLQDNMTFKTSGTLTLAGNITLGTNNATLGSSLSMGTGTNYFMTNSTGVLKRSVGNAGTFAFPVGNSAYNPVSITNNSGAADEFNLRVLDEVYRDGTSGSVLTSPRVKRTWLIGKTNANAGSGIDFVFNWNTGESTSGLNSPRLYHYNGTEWEKQTGTTSSTSSSLTYTGYTGTFSPFTIGDDVVLLPVSWLHFDCGKQTANGTELNWSTASEENSSRFVVERSQNGQTFEPIGFIPAAGYSHSIRQYRFTDPNPFKTRGYYRIAMEENNGHRLYTSVCMNNGNPVAENTPVKVYPNPSKGSVNIHTTEGGTYHIADMAGRHVRAGKLDGITQIEGLKAGVYLITILSGDNRYTQKLTVE